eukprot:1161814-Pelagomonas_calceolata.AAC.11
MIQRGFPGLTYSYFSADFEVPPKTAPCQLTAGGHLCTQGTPWGPPAGLGVQLEGQGIQELSGGMLRIGRGGLDGKRQDITQGCGA